MRLLLLPTIPLCTSKARMLPLLAVTFMVIVMLAWFPVCSLAQQADAEVLVAEGILAFDAKQFDEARAYFARAISLDPGHGRAYYYLARCHLAQGRPDLAIAPLTTLHQLRPNRRGNSGP